MSGLKTLTTYAALSHGFDKFRLELLFEYSYQLILNGNRKEGWQIDQIEGGVTCVDLKLDLLEVGGVIGDANKRPANWTAGL